jgi:hypothetical protein
VTYDLTAQALGEAYGHREILPIFEKHKKLTAGAVVGRYS